VGGAKGVPVVDLYEAMEAYAMKRQLLGESIKCAAVKQEVDMFDPKLLDELLCDGLHLSTQGNRLLYDAVKKSIALNYPHLASETIPLEFPHHSSVDTTDLIGSLKP
jgi:lysophospholipase L1-like esterase